jgi:hypothetical protein
MNGTLRIILSLVFSVAMVAGLSAKPRGFVRNSKGEPVAHASIMVYDGAGKMMAFAISDGKGYFAIDKEMDYAKKKNRSEMSGVSTATNHREQCRYARQYHAANRGTSD